MRYHDQTRRLKGLCYSSLAIMAMAFATPVLAQSTLDRPVGEFHSYHLDSGTVANAQRGAAVVYETTVTVKDAAWLRLYFSKVELAAGSYLRMTSALDNDVQELDAYGIAMWSNTSAYFNGDTVYLEVIAGPQTSENQVVLDRVTMEANPAGSRGPCAEDDCGICGVDNRAPSNELWSGRIMPVGCTGSVFNEESCVVSAGHCADGGWDNTIEFNVPDSASNCALYHPPAADQFPITDHLFVNGGVGNDWAVMTTGTNYLGETIYERYGEYRPIASTLGNPGDTVTVWGYGADNNNPTRNQTQQTHTDTIGTRYSNYYTAYVDITYGNSGSGLMRNDQIIGIVTHCPCPLSATRVDLSAFEDAREQLCPSQVPVNDDCDNAIQACVGTHSGYTLASSNDGSASCGDSNSSPDVWYYYTPATSGTATVHTCSGGDYDGVLSVHSGCPGTAANQIACDDDGCGSQGGMSTVTFGVTGDETYLIRVTGYDGDSGHFTLTVSGPDCDLTPPQPSPLEWEIPPTPVSASEVTMTAVEATDAVSPPVDYSFNCTEGGGHYRSWGSRVYNDTGLSANTVVAYQCQARDSATPPNEGGWSWPPTSTATHIETPTDVDDLSIGDDYIEVEATGSFTNFYVGNSGIMFRWWLATSNPDVDPPVGESEVHAQTTTTANGLLSGTEYTFRAWGLNQDGVETPDYAQHNYTTSGGSACGTILGDINGDWQIDGNDIGGFVRAKLGQAPLGEENQACANYGGTLQEDTAAFVADLLVP